MITGTCMDGEKSLSESWIGLTRFALLNKIHQKDLRTTVKYVKWLAGV